MMGHWNPAGRFCLSNNNALFFLKGTAAHSWVREALAESGEGRRWETTISLSQLLRLPHYLLWVEVLLQSL